MSPNVQISSALPSFEASDPGSWNHLVEHAQMLESLGVDRIVVSDHVAFGRDLTSYARPELGGREGGVQPTSPDGLWLEPLTTLSYLAARTDRIRLGTNILLAALRPAALLAKTAATLDVLSGGRLDLGVGVGWQRAEYDAVGVDFDGRGRLLDRTLEVCQLLWRGDEASFTSPGLNFDRIHQMPKPLQPEGIPIWVSGTVNRASARRLARFGSGWIPWGPAADDVASAIGVMRAAVADAGGDPHGFGVVGQIPRIVDAGGRADIGAMARYAHGMAQSGVTDLRVTWWPRNAPGDPNEVMAALVAAIRSW
ncbi:TIGR03619 family F420-dependent LLM class oxidoreductase [Mycolicibacterium vinylchloridicum]|uniref:TIGR03619 family F420-dependent LLM class oxidoreductase n=1 Tax=Mycolicibacterium vinylchloridicum TaxID=2736928 RepID=UPI0015CCE8A8|nr:TIGR03619 family F420-dependent LLM class oxidoreductase [Mycolicibacterium vinylchloridicum]